MKTISTILLASLIATAPVSAEDSPEVLESGSRVRVQTNPPAGAMARNGDFVMPGRSVGQEGEGITVSLEERSATFSRPGQRLEGELLSADAETLTLRLRGWDEPVTVLRRAVSRLEVRAPGRSRTRSAVIGGAIGAGVALLFMGATGDQSGDSPLSPFLTGLSGVAGVVGVGVGALVGLAAGGESWTTVDPQPALRLSVGPTRGGAGAALTLSF